MNFVFNSYNIFKMSSNSSSTEYKIYLDSSKKEEILGDAKTYEKYVILQNETLHNKVNQLQDKVNSLESTIEELQDDNDRMEKSKGYTKNLLKNFSELDKLNIKWREESNKHYKEIQKKQNNFIKTTSHIIMLFELLFTAYLAIYFYYLNSIYKIIFRVVLYILFIYLSREFHSITLKYMEFDLIEKTNKVKTIKEDIKKINDCYDFINEYIDNV